MAILTFEQLKQSAQVYVNEWTTVSVREESLMPGDSIGAKWFSYWDNWLIPSHDPSVPSPSGSMEPMISINGIALDPTENLYTITGGDSVRGLVSLNTSVGADSSVLATYRRTLFRDSFWTNNLTQAAGEVASRLLQSSPYNITAIDDQVDPWAIIVKQAGRNALANLQTMLAGLGKTQMEGMTVDTSRAAVGLSDTLNQLGEEIDRDIVATRWRRSPNMRSVFPVYPLPGPFTNPWGDHA